MRLTRGSSHLGGVAFLAGALCIVSTVPASATPVTLETSVSINTGCDPFDSGSCLTADDPVDIEIWGPFEGLPGWTPNWTQGWGPISHDATYGSPGQELSVSADANADFGKLQVRAAAEYDLTAAGEDGAYRFVSANGTFGDVLTPQADPSDPSLNGTNGVLEVQIGLDGRLESSGSATAAVLTLVGWETSLDPAGEQPLALFGSDTDINQTFTVNIPFVWGEDVGLFMFMAAAVGTARPCLPEEPCEFGVIFERQTGIGAGSADFFNTLAITGLIPYDQFGNPILDARFSSASNTRYTVEQGAVPEPATLLLMGSGLAMGLRRFRRKKS